MTTFIADNTLEMTRLIFSFSKQSEFMKIWMISQHTQRLQAFKNYLQLLLKKL